MKIKTDFVTNSSSTCYVMTSIVSGHLPVMGPFDGLKQLKGPFKYNFVYDYYAHIMTDHDEEDADADDKPVYNFDFCLNNSRDYDEQSGDEKSITIFESKIDLLNPYWNSIENVTKDFIEEILFKLLEAKVDASQLTYLAFPSSITGDGWDGGDPLGPSEYTYTYELNKAETKMGILTIIGSKIISELGSIENALNLNEILLKDINKEGLFLEEHNDKNS